MERGRPHSREPLGGDSSLGRRVPLRRRLPRLVLLAALLALWMAPLRARAIHRDAPSPLGCAGSLPAEPTAPLAADAAVQPLDLAALHDDDRLGKPLTLAEKGVAFGALVAQISKTSGVELAASPVVADDRVVLFCRAAPLRDVMARIARLFGFVWVRRGEPGNWRYELTQTQQALAEEARLRERDRLVALRNIDQEFEQYRGYLSLTLDELRALQATAPPEEQDRLRSLVNVFYGPASAYLQLSPADKQALLAGQTLTFSSALGNPRPLSSRVVEVLMVRRGGLAGPTRSVNGVELPRWTPPAWVQPRTCPPSCSSA